MSRVNVTALVVKLFPDSRESDLVARIRAFEAIRQKVGENMPIPENSQYHRNIDYRQGYEIGEYLYSQGEDYDVKDLHGLADELMQDMDYSQLTVENVEAFRDGIYNGYSINSNLHGSDR